MDHLVQVIAAKAGNELQITCAPPGGRTVPSSNGASRDSAAGFTSSSGATATKSFTFSRVFAPSSDHDQVIVAFEKQHRYFLKGQNVTIFAYGETGSGKTTTMAHLAAAFTKSWMTAVVQDSSLSLHLSAIEVDQEAVFDLLAAAPRQRRLDVWNSDAQKVIW